MAQRNSVVGKVILWASCCVIVAWSFLFLTSLRARYQAQSLLMVLRSLKVGSTTVSEVRPILTRYHLTNVPGSWSKERSADEGFSGTFANGTAWMFGSSGAAWKIGMKLHFLRYIGLAPWGAGADMYFRAGRLCELRYSVGTEINGPDKRILNLNLSTEESSRPHSDYIFSGGGPPMFGSETINLPSDATLREFDHAFAYNLSCVTNVGGCRTICQLLPLKPIWEDILARRQDTEARIPRAVLSDPVCSAP